MIIEIIILKDKILWNHALKSLTIIKAFFSYADNFCRTCTIENDFSRHLEIRIYNNIGWISSHM